MSLLTRWTDDRREMSVFDDLRRQMNKIFDDMTGNRLSAFDTAFGTMPKATIKDEGAKVVVEAEIPGFTEKDIKVNLYPDMLTIVGDRKLETKKNGERTEEYHFSRSFYIPGRIDPEKCMAELKNGILTVTMNRTPESQPRQISVKHA